MPFLVFLFTVTMVSLWGQDQTVNLVNPSATGPVNGLMVWGDYGAAGSFKAFSAQPSPANIGDVKPGHIIPNKVVAFTADRAPGYQDATWTDGPPRNPVNVTYFPVVSLRVKAWVLCGRVNAAGTSCLPGALSQAERDAIMVKLAGVNSLFVAESAGILLDLSVPTDIIKDETADTVRTGREFDRPQPC